jgi:hypothetical protein
MILTEPVNLLCDLIETGTSSFDANAPRCEAPQAVEFHAGTAGNYPDLSRLRQ